MAPLNYKRMLTAERFCLCQVSQQPPLKELIRHPFSFGGARGGGGESSTFWGGQNVRALSLQRTGAKWRLNLLVNFLQIRQFYFSTPLPSSRLRAVALCTNSSLLLGGPYFHREE